VLEMWKSGALPLGMSKEGSMPNKGKVQQKEVRRAVEEKEVVSRKWHWNERKVERGGYLVERRERG